jgi:mRNA-degrading endonuclease YafQ of YafQ-DinJ toxin-antitoxin module
VIQTLQEDPFTSSLRTHGLSGALKGLYACSVTDDIRIVFKLADGSIRLLNIGTHDEVYSV